MTDFESIYRTYFDDVYRYISGLSGDKNLAEEITSETFFKAMGAIDGFRSDCSMRIWLCQIAKNCYYSHVEKSRRTVHVDESELSNRPDDSMSPEQQFIHRDQAREIRMILHDIPDPYKEVFMWRTFGELSFKQIGQIFGKSENWACVTHHRAKAMIQKRLEQSNHEK